MDVYFKNQRNIYYICHNYITFQKDSIETIINNDINGIEANIFVRTNPYTTIVSNIFQSIKRNRGIDTNHIPKKCRVISTPVPYIPFDCEYLRIGERHFKSVNKAIQKNTINKPDLVHTHFLWSSGYVGKCLKEEYDVPFVATGHGYDVYDLPFKSDAWKKRITDVLNAADHVITVSNSNHQCLKKLNIETPISVIPNGFNSNLFKSLNQDECRNKLGLPVDKKILLTVGNCVAVKGHKYLIEAMKQIHAMHPDVLCVIVGGGTDFQKEKSLVSSLGLDKCILIPGGRPHDEIPIWMNACDLFVLPSLNESFGVVNIEALGCRKPVIATNVGGIPEIISSDEYGLLCKPGDVTELTSVLETALEREWNENKIIEYAKQYTWEEICRKITSIYHHLLK